jgi:hypothetical protein
LSMPRLPSTRTPAGCMLGTSRLCGHLAAVRYAQTCAAMVGADIIEARGRQAYLVGPSTANQVSFTYLCSVCAVISPLRLYTGCDASICPERLACEMGFFSKRITACEKAIQPPHMKKTGPLCILRDHATSRWEGGAGYCI